MKNSNSKKGNYGWTHVLLVGLVIGLVGNALEEGEALTTEQLLSKDVNSYNFDLSVARDTAKACNDWKRVVKTNPADVKKMDNKCAQAIRMKARALQTLADAKSTHGDKVFTEAYKAKYTH